MIQAKQKFMTATDTQVDVGKNLALSFSTSDVMVDRSERPMNPEIGNCYLFSDPRREIC